MIINLGNRSVARIEVGCETNAYVTITNGEVIMVMQGTGNSRYTVIPRSAFGEWTITATWDSHSVAKTIDVTEAGGTYNVDVSQEIVNLFYNGVFDQRAGTMLSNGCSSFSIGTNISITQSGVWVYHEDNAPSRGAPYLTNKIDVTNYEKIIMTVSGGANVRSYGVGLFITTDTPKASTWESVAVRKAMFPTGIYTGELEIDVTDLTGEYYVGFGTSTSYTGFGHHDAGYTISRIRLEVGT